MKTNEKKKGKLEIILIAIIILLLILVLIGFAYARYITSQNGQAEAQVAKWSFKVVDGNPSTIDVLDFPITRTDNNTDVDSGTIAPGTYGEFEIDIDARGTETILTYEIRIGFTNKPANLKFYYDENKENEILLDSNGQLVLSKFLSLNDSQNIQNNLIYWSWPLETGTTAQEIAQNDILDSQYIGRNLTMAITITGVQMQDDNSAPTVVYGNNGNNTASQNASTQVTINDEGTGVQQASLKYLWTTRNKNVSELTKSDFTGNTSGSFTSGETLELPNGCAGDYYLYIYAEDNYGNSIITKSNKFTASNVKPEANIALSTTEQTNNVTMTIEAYAPIVIYDNGYVNTKSRDWLAYNSTPDFDYAGKKLRISGLAKTIEAVDESKTIAVGFAYSNTSGTGTIWVHAYEKDMESLKNETSFSVIYKVSTSYTNTIGFIPWVQINIPVGTRGYEMEYKNIKYEYFDSSKMSSVKVNGTNITITNGVGTYTATENGTYTIEITDIYGNVKTYTQEISNIIQ